MAEAKKNKPVKEIRIGNVKAAIWSNETEQDPRFNTTSERIYREGVRWKSSTSFSRDDLLVLAKAVDQVHTLDSGGRIIDNCYLMTAAKLRCS